jgi:BirA family biotin operon repressor/biotin-[acetyl-CoA-carboxylase] ligase
MVSFPVMNCGPLQPEPIADGLGCRRLTGPVHVVDSVTSSNDIAWQQVEAGAGDGTVFFAEHQTAGRGRFGRTWESPRGASVLCSVVVKDRTGVLQRGGLSLICAIAACDAIRAAVGLPAEIRWPNDLLIRGRKVGGVLVESRPGRNGGRTFVAGIGINCLQHANHFPPELRERATSLDLESPAPIDRIAVCRALLEQLDGWLAGTKDASPHSVRDAWCDRAIGVGGRVRLRRDGKEFSGVVVDLDPTAALIVQLDRGGRSLFDAESTTILES